MYMMARMGITITAAMCFSLRTAVIIAHIIPRDSLFFILCLMDSTEGIRHFNPVIASWLCAGVDSAVISAS